MFINNQAVSISSTKKKLKTTTEPNTNKQTGTETKMLMPKHITEEIYRLINLSTKNSSALSKHGSKSSFTFILTLFTNFINYYYYNILTALILHTNHNNLTCFNEIDSFVIRI